jgi:acyl-CoA reductase-like NAD-dependent aldehyde dehydrogenase
MSDEPLPLFLAGEPRTTGRSLDVLDKTTGERAARVAAAGPREIEEGIARAAAAAREMAALPAWRRRDVLEHCARRFEERAEELAQVLCTEAGKPIRDSRGEVTRLVDTFRDAAGEATRIRGEVLPLGTTPRADGYRGMWKRVPVGPCSFLTPFNFPLNLVAHKVAPAIAAGCPFVLKPSERTPLGALLVGEVLAETDLPAGAFSVLPCELEHVAPFVEDPRLKLLSFTGSSKVGWDLKARAGAKKVQLELGGNAAVIVDEDADVEDAVERILVGAFYQSGQSCIGVQRILVHERLHDGLVAELVRGTEGLVVGDPRDERTDVGPLIDEAAAERLEGWIASATARGARVLTGGRREGATLWPTLLEGVPADEPLCAEEAFGPVAVIETFTGFDDALERVNAGRYGLQAGVFTRDLSRALAAWDRLEVGGVVVGDVPSWRVDHMPYGGVRESGLGREGARFAIEEMTELRMLVIRER